MFHEGGGKRGRGDGGTNNVSDERSKNDSLAGSEMTILSSCKETAQHHYEN